MDRSLESVDRSQKKYAVYAFLSALLLIVTFVPSGLEGMEVAERITLDVCLFLPRILLAGATVIFALMGSLFSKRERNAFRAVKNQLKLISSTYLNHYFIGYKKSFYLEQVKLMCSKIVLLLLLVRY